MGSYLQLFICVDDYLSLFVIIGVFDIKDVFLLFLIIYLCKEVFFC